MKNKTILATVAASIIVTTEITTAQPQVKGIPKQTQNIAQKYLKPFTSESATSDTATPFGMVYKRKSNLDAKPHSPAEKMSLEDLAGPIHNKYGIRDDIYAYIQKTIPPDNEMAMNAAIKNAAASQAIYYKATEEEAIKLATTELISLQCLTYALGDSWLDVSRGIGKLMRNTKDRDSHMWKIDEEYFGWKVIGYGGLTDEQIQEKCKTGNY